MQVVIVSESPTKNHITYYLYDDSFVNVEAVARVKVGRECIELLYINVHRNYRGNGKGSYLLNRILTDFSDSSVVVETFKERVEWYQKFGFAVISNKANIYVLEKLPFTKEISLNSLSTSR